MEWPKWTLCFWGKDSPDSSSSCRVVSIPGDILCPAQAFQHFVQVTSAACRDARLGIFKMECSHKMNKALCEASSHLGMAKNAIKMSAEAFLGQVNVLYQRVNSNDSKKSLGQTFSSIKLHCTVKYGFYSVARFRRSAAVDKLWQLWYDSIRYDMMVFKFQIVIFLLVCHPKKRPQLYPPIAFIIGFFAVFCGLQWSFFDVPNQQDNC